MYIRKGPPVSLASLGITIASFDAHFPTDARRFDRVTTGYSMYETLAPRTLAWAIGECIVFAASNERGIVTSIWFSNLSVELEAFLLALNRSWPMILACW